MRILVFLFGLSFCVQAFAANVCMGVSNTGSGSGADWNNQKAMSSVASGSWVRGNTYYFADGVYGDMQINSANSGTTRISFLKATIADHGTATGWSDAYGDGTANFTLISMSKNYITIDGQTGGGPGGGTNLTSWTTGFGFVVDTSAQTNATAYPGVFFGEQTQSVTDNCIVRHVEVIGNNTAPSTNPNGQANDAFTSWGSTNLLIEYCYTHDLGRCPFVNVSTGSNVTFQYCYVGPYIYFDPGGHSEIFSTIGTDFHIRWNLFAYVIGTGGVMFNMPGSTGRNEVYGNIFAHFVSDTSWSGVGNGIVGSKSGGGTEPVVNVRIYNNTFYRTLPDNASVAQTFGSSPGYLDSSSLEKNNLFYGPIAAGLTAPTHDYNWYRSMTNASAPTETNRQVDSGTCFVAPESGNFRLTLNSNAGVDLSADVPGNAVDMLGNTRTTWSRGALEYQAASGTGGSSYSGNVNFSGNVTIH